MVSLTQDHSGSLTHSPLVRAEMIRRNDQATHAFVEIFDTVVATCDHGPLAGLVFATKDMLAYKNRQPFCGLASAPALGLSGTAPVIDTLLAAGASLAGFTTLTALAYEPSGLNGDGSRPVNPWGRHLITGGSSSGSAVAVAAGLVDFAIGSDTAGSLRIPAQACGVASYKPSFGLLPVTGAMVLAPSLDCLGFLARDVGLLQVLAGLFEAPAQAAPSGLCFVTDLDDLCAPDVCAQTTQLRSDMTKSGVAYSGIDLADLIKAADAPLFTLLEGEAAQSFASLLQRKALPDGLAYRLGKGARWTDAQLQEARDAAAVLHAQWLARVPVGHCVVLPAMPCCTPVVDMCTPGQEQFSARALYALSEFTRFGSLLGLPVVTIPVGLDHAGAPLAIQVMGHRGHDHAVLAAAKALQTLCGFDRIAFEKTGRRM